MKKANRNYKKLVIRIAIDLFIIYLFFLVCAIAFGDRFIFTRWQSSYDENLKGLTRIEANDGHMINALYLPHRDGEFLFLYCHGNAEDIGDEDAFANVLRIGGYDFLSFDYRGYGLDLGRATEKNVYSDIISVYDYAVETLGYEPWQIIAYGRSVGAGAVLELATKRDVGALVVESGFVSAFKVVTKVPLFPFDKFNNIRKIKQINRPIMIVHGLEDEIVPAWHGKKLYEAANEPKMHHWVEKAGHNDMLRYVGFEYWGKIDELLEMSRKQNKADHSELKKANP